MTTRPIWTSAAIAAFLAGDEPCHTCHGHGRITVTSDHDRRTCPSCRGAGVPITPREAYATGLTRHEWKARRQIAGRA